MEFSPAIVTLKEECPQGESLTQLVGQLFADKGSGLELMRHLASQPPHFIGALLGHLVMHHPHHSSLAAKLQRSLAEAILPHPRYHGSHEENRAVNAAVHHSEVERLGLRSTTWWGASGAYNGGGLQVPPQMGSVSILVVGSGAAGIMAARALANAGFANILVMEKRAQTGGIWAMEGLKGAPMAVPFPLRFEQVLLEQAPRPGSDVTRFLGELVAPPRHWGWPAFPRVVRAEVLRITPGDLGHRVEYLDERGQERQLTVPLVINAIGVGEPLQPSRPGTMTTDVPHESAGLRWQEIWSEERARGLRGRMVVFISLSNSTLEMLRQIQHYNRQGMGIDYRVVTHYPWSSLLDPLTRIEHRGKTFRFYRDLENYRLLRVAGDLEHVSQAFEEARDTHHIVSHVDRWSLEHGDRRHLVAAFEDGETRRMPCDELYTLIGYGPRAETLEGMGLSVNHRYLGAVDQAYDGEALRLPGAAGRELYWPGYFCFGLRNAYNPNEVLLPGLFFRLPNLVAGVVCRAAEYALQARA
jgi:NAD(P)-binding Rossmann-like domain